MFGGINIILILVKNVWLFVPDLHPLLIIVDGKKIEVLIS